MNLGRYLDRIGVREPVHADLATLRRVHRAHLVAIPYENLDIHLDRRVSLDPAAAFQKLVEQRRGGWCYEMNGLLAWALREIGFEVALLSGTVGREKRGDAVEGNHLVLLVSLETPHLADVGFGDGFFDPVPLAEGGFEERGFQYALERVGFRWRFRNHQWGGADGFDFTLEPRRIEDFADRCHELQTSPTSGFVQTTVIQRIHDTGISSLRGAVLREIAPTGVVERTVASGSEYADVLRDRFRLDLPEAANLWPAIMRRHDEWLASPAKVAG